MNTYDVIIIGSGFGGLLSAALLSKEGYKVCVLEKNTLYGGCFQSFPFKSYLLDTGIHYVGSLTEGQFLHRLFTYLGIYDKLHLRKMDAEAYDIMYSHDKCYKYCMGYEALKERLLSYFPKEKKAIASYVAVLRSMGETMGAEHFSTGELAVGVMKYLSQSAYQYLQSITKNQDLINLLFSTSAMLNGHFKESMTLYHHGMIINSYVEGAYRFVDGSMQVPDLLVGLIRANGGEVRVNNEVTKILSNDAGVCGVVVKNGEQFHARKVISNVHPLTTLKLFEKNKFLKKAFHTRIAAQRNSDGFFSTYLLLESDKVPYLNSNIYIHNGEHINDLYNSFFMSFNALGASPNYTNIVTMISPFPNERCQPYEDSLFNRRSQAYYDMKARVAEQMEHLCYDYYPALKGHVKDVFTTTPLSYRDYTGSPGGSAYGIIKAYHNLHATMVSSKTRMPNFYFTGQNMNVHGAYGVGISALYTCEYILGKSYLAKKIAYD